MNERRHAIISADGVITETDDAMAFIKRQTELADRAMTSWQKKLTKGDYVLTSIGDVVIVGKILFDSCGNYKFAVSYCEMCQQGEYGDIHAGDVVEKLSLSRFKDLLKNMGITYESVVQKLSDDADELAKDEADQMKRNAV